MLRKIILILYFISSAYLICLGQGQKEESQGKARPNLSGTWKLDKVKGESQPKNDVILVITQLEPEIRIIRKVMSADKEYIQKLVYYSDGQSQLNSAPKDEGEIRAKAKWKGNKLVSSYSINSVAAGEVTIRLDIIDEWELSTDGKVLTQKQTISRSVSGSGPPNQTYAQGTPHEVKRIYKRTS